MSKACTAEDVLLPALWTESCCTFQFLTHSAKPNYAISRDGNQHVCCHKWCALLQAGLTGLSIALQALQAQVSRHQQQAQEAQAKAEHEASMLQERLAEAQGSSESAREGSSLLQLQLTDSLEVAKSAKQDVSKLKQQLAGSQAAVAQKEQELATQVPSSNVHTWSNCAFGMLGLVRMRVSPIDTLCMHMPDNFDHYQWVSSIS